MITSNDNTRVKLAYALMRQSKVRRKEDLIALEGTRLISDALTAGFQPEFILHDPDSGALDNLHVDPALTLEVSPGVIRHVADTETPQGVIGVFKTPSPAMPQPLERVLILDAIGDPGNLGTLLRTARAAGVQTVFLAPGCTDAWSPKALRAGMGAHFRIPALEANWTRIAVMCAKLNIYLADMTGEASYDQADWRSPWALIVGSEAHGASPQAEDLAAQRVYIPMHAETESLNAAIAAAVILFEAARQQRNG